MIVLGINSVYHESAAAIIVDGDIVAAAEEERFNRYKHGKPANTNNANVLPLQAIEYCLSSINLKIDQIDLVAFSFDPALREKYFEVDPLSIPKNWGSLEGEEFFRRSLENIKFSLSENFGDKIAEKLVWVSHHLAHAASAFYPSGFSKSALLIIDGIGENASTMMGFGDMNDLKIIQEIHYPHSLGFLWEKICQFLGFSEYDACKVMGLAAYGQKEILKDCFNKFAKITNDGFILDNNILRFRLPEFEPLEALFGKRREKGEPINEIHKNIAAALQEFTDVAVLSLVQRLYRLYPSENLCLAGGVALNCVTNWLVKEKGEFKNLFIPSAPHDAGTAIGAALYTYYTRSNAKLLSIVQLNPYTGPEFSQAKIRLQIEKFGLQGRISTDSASEAAHMIANGKIVGWFQGRMEFGPRALGNRSLLADPRHSTTRELLNRKVKHREDFRPFAPSVLADKANDWFEIGRPSESLKYMLFSCPVRPEKAKLIPAVLHIDGTSRLQLVDKDLNTNYYRLIEQFEQITGIPLVLNTSFNDSEPIVCTPRDALLTFQGTLIDAVVIGNIIVERKS
ncbi:unnamed protein product [Adineta steineri]|uniref:Carbamoyl transferase n=1 Tax=Adineta steineri TaxID=433720 RepID=A0A814RWR2_9BILA|nr:unnamed protein product [Adineta steineri]